ncbi:hypothetical protein [Actinoplanes sp. G11-F43]|uniref:8-oxoguanine DNA glycosylase OGG fold protein n=1 Tax=Actinoplanes sp. G11-F43 TaxID=3424130 RepID=UPI003D33F0FC
MDLTDGRAARAEALAGRMNEQQVAFVAEACRRRLEKLGPAGVRAHAIAVDPGKWPEISVGESITRGDVFDLAHSGALDLFTASYVFGMGRRGYGRSRYDKIVARAVDLAGTLDVVRDIGLCQGPIFAYAQLYGGQDFDHRTSSGTPGWSRIAGFGPAFFTKFLYFAVPGALILDARLAYRVAHLTGNDYGYLHKGRPAAWTPYRYAVYLHWMRQAAADVSVHTEVTPELLEVTLFDLSLADLPGRPETTVPAETDDDGEAAD